MMDLLNSLGGFSGPTPSMVRVALTRDFDLFAPAATPIRPELSDSTAGNAYPGGVLDTEQ
jgi:hypothetical protein